MLAHFNQYLMLYIGQFLYQTQKTYHNYTQKSYQFLNYFIKSIDASNLNTI